MIKPSKKPPKVSVVVTVYNAQRYLVRCVDSILNQTFRDFELILVDDGSTDNSSKLCDEYKKRDKRIKIIHQSNEGQTIARQNGLKIAEGEYVLIFDSDDWLELNALEVMVDAAVENNADIVTFNGYFNYVRHRCPVTQPVKSGCYDKEGLIAEVYPTMVYSGTFFLFGIFACMWNKLFRRELLTPNLMAVDSRVKIYEDGLTTFACFLDAEKVCVLGDQFLYNYRDNKYSLTRSYCKDQFKSTILMINALKEINKKHIELYDLSVQIEYFYLFVLRSIMVEEFYYHHNKNFIDRYMYVRSMVNYIGTQKMCKKTSYYGMTKRMKLFFVLLGARFTVLVMLLAMAKAYYMRSKVYARHKAKLY